MAIIVVVHIAAGTGAYSGSQLQLKRLDLYSQCFASHLATTAGEVGPVYMVLRRYKSHWKGVRHESEKIIFFAVPQSAPFAG